MTLEILKHLHQNKMSDGLSMLDFYIISLISSDVCVNIKSCEESYDKLFELKTLLLISDLDAEIKEKYLTAIVNYTSLKEGA